MGYKKRTYKVAEVMAGNPPAPEWRLIEDGKVLDPKSLIIFNKDTDKMPKVDHYLVRFDIKDFKDSQLRFAPEKNDVLWANRGTSCPTSPCYMSDVFYVSDMDDDGEWIEVTNEDMVKEDFWFTLNLVPKSDPTTKNFVALDPGGGNQNGGLTGSTGGGSAYETATDVFIAAAGGIGAVLTTGAAATGSTLTKAGLVAAAVGLVISIGLSALRPRPIPPRPTPKG